MNEKLLQKQLILCAEQRSLDGLARAISRGAKLDFLGEEGLGALHVCARIGSVDGIRLLVSKGADVHFKDSIGWTALTWACYSKHLSCVEALVDAGARVNTRSNSGSRPINVAVASKDAAIVAYLIRHGADFINPYERNRPHFDAQATLYEYARERGWRDVIAEIEAYELKIENGRGRTSKAAYDGLCL